MANKKAAAKKKTTAKKTAAGRKPTSNREVSVMESLSQAAAAWLAGLEDRTLRSHAEIPRDEAGKYDARDIVRFVAGRVPPAQLTDAEIEKTQIIAELPLYDREAVPAVLAFLESIDSRYGTPGLAAFAKHMIRHLRNMVAADPAHYQIPTADQMEAELRTELANLVTTRREDASARQARVNLQMATVCDECGRRRQGNEWIDSPAPSGYEVFGGICPKCYENPPSTQPSTSKAETPDKMLLDDVMDKKPGKP